MKIDYSLYLITDSQLCAPRKLLAVVADAIDAGVTCVQLREKNATQIEIFNCGKELLTILRPRKIPLIINDYANIAFELDADGVHLGQSDMSYFQARALLGSNKIIGLSIENLLQAEHFQHLAVDYFGVGPIFATTTKLDAAQAIGIEQLKLIRQTVHQPLVAIGGINHHNAKQVWQCGVNGIAVASAIMAASDVGEMVRKLMKSEK
jgi:thiamine-phosphate pyrophosphorylase